MNPIAQITWYDRWFDRVRLYYASSYLLSPRMDEPNFLDIQFGLTGKTYLVDLTKALYLGPITSLD